MRASGMPYLRIIWSKDAKDDLPDSDYIIHIQRTFTRDTRMIDKGTIGAIQIHDRNLSYILICPDFGVLTRSRGIFHDNIVGHGTPNGSLSIL
jgi:hypothetical protein